MSVHGMHAGTSCKHACSRQESRKNLWCFLVAALILCCRFGMIRGDGRVCMLRMFLYLQARSPSLKTRSRIPVLLLPRLRSFAVFLDRNMELVVQAYGDKETLFRPCVDCGLMTGRFCDGLEQGSHAAWQGGFCSAQDRLPDEKWAVCQSTPLCSSCEVMFGACHFCRRVAWCTPPTSTRRSTQIIK